MKLPPHSQQAEQAVLGALLTDDKAIADVADLISAEDFYRADHRAIYEAIQRCDEAGKAFDAVSLADTLERMNLLDEAGGLDHLVALAKGSVGSANVRSYAEIIRDKAVLRRLISAGAHIQHVAQHTEGRTASEVLDDAQSRVMQVERPTGKGPRHILADGKAWIEEMDQRSEQGGAIVGLSTGLTDLDNRTLGMEGGDLWILAARPSMGKTSVAMSMMLAVAKAKKPVLFFSLEMPEKQLITRAVASLGRIDSEKVRKADLDPEEWQRVMVAMTQLKEMPLYIDTQGGITLTDIRARARRVKRRHGLGLIVVDYLQLMSGKGENRTQEVTEISKGLKNVAKEMNVPVVALSQLNRGVESRQNKRPIMADLRESGSIEQDADVIAFLYRETQYNDNCPFPMVAELDIAKQRNGPTGTVLLHFNGPQMRFSDLDHESKEEYRNWERSKSATTSPRGFNA